MKNRQFQMLADVEETRRSGRAYMQAHRDEWSGLGFRNVTCFVHDDDRDLILAELYVRRCDKVIQLSESRGTDEEILVKLSRRNMPKPPAAGTIAGYYSAAEDSTAELEVVNTLNIAAAMLKKQFALVTLFGKEADYKKRTRIAARGVAYSGSAAARYKLAKAMLDTAPLKPRSVFGVEGSAAVEEELNWVPEDDL